MMSPFVGPVPQLPKTHIFRLRAPATESETDPRPLIGAQDMSVDTQRDKQQCAEVKRTTGIIPLSLSRHEHVSGSTSFWGPTPQNTIARTYN